MSDDRANMAPAKTYPANRAGEHGEEVALAFVIERAYLSGNTAEHGTNADDHNERRGPCGGGAPRRDFKNNYESEPKTRRTDMWGNMTMIERQQEVNRISEMAFTRSKEQGISFTQALREVTVAEVAGKPEDGKTKDKETKDSEPAFTKQNPAGAGMALVEKARAFSAEHNVSFAQAMTTVQGQNPELLEASLHEASEGGV